MSYEGQDAEMESGTRKMGEWASKKRLTVSNNTLETVGTAVPCL